MNNLKKGTLVFVRSESYPPWPSEIERRYDNGLYKVNFIGEKSYTRIEVDKIDLFTEERAKQIHSQLEDKKLSKAIFVALKEFQNRRKRGQIDPELADLLKKPHPPLDLSMYKHMAKSENKSYPIIKYAISGSTDDNLQEIGTILDKVYDFIVLPVNEKLPQYLDAAVYSERIGKMEQEISRLKQLFLKEEDNYRPTVGQKELPEKQALQQQKGSQSLLPSSSSKKPLPTSLPPTTTLPKSQFIQKLVDTKIIQRLIMTIKAYESFREENQKHLEQTINYLKEKFNVLYDKYREEYNKKKLPSQKDRIMLEKFENFQAYL